jgi:hypothetical protein
MSPTETGASQFAGKKRLRLSNKQRSFLFSVLADGRTVQSAMSDLRISAHTLYKWLYKPLFLQAIRSHLAGYQIQTRITAASQAPLSVDSFTIFTDTQDPKKARQACLDALKTYSAFYAAYKNALEDNSTPVQ